MRPLPWTVTTRKSAQPTHACVTPAGRRGSPDLQPTLPRTSTRTAPARGLIPSRGLAHQHTGPGTGARRTIFQARHAIVRFHRRHRCCALRRHAAHSLRLADQAETARRRFCLPVSEPAVYGPRRTVAVRLAGYARARKSFVRGVVHRDTRRSPMKRGSCPPLGTGQRAAARFPGPPPPWRITRGWRQVIRYPSAVSMQEPCQLSMSLIFKYLCPLVIDLRRKL